MLRIGLTSLRSIYRREVERGLARTPPRATITEDDLVLLPRAIQTYLRRVGVIGKPRVHDFRARFTGGLRRGRDAAWMTIRAEQHSFFDEPARIFLVEASLHGIPFEALHVYVGPSATMRVRAAFVFDVADARGPVMNRSETVTLFNDMCLLAPASLIDADVAWREIDARTIKATFTNAGNTIDAVLSFGAEGDLVNFVSHDRYQSDGKTYKRFPWATPVEVYRDYHGVRLPARAEARWHEPDGEWTYARFELEDIEYNVRDAQVRAEQPAASWRAPVVTVKHENASHAASDASR